MLLLSRFSHVRLCATPQTAAHQAPPSLGFSRQESWSSSPCHPPGDLPDSGIKPAPLKSPALADRFFTTSTTWEDHYLIRVVLILLLNLDRLKIFFRKQSMNMVRLCINLQLFQAHLFSLSNVL